MNLSTYTACEIPESFGEFSDKELQKKSISTELDIHLYKRDQRAERFFELKEASIDVHDKKSIKNVDDKEDNTASESENGSSSSDESDIIADRAALGQTDDSVDFESSVNEKRLFQLLESEETSASME